MGNIKPQFNLQGIFYYYELQYDHQGTKISAAV